MAEQKQTKTVIWEQFTQTPIRADAGENPVTKVINMELAPDKSIVSRSNFKTISCFATAPENSIVTHLQNSSTSTTLVAKVGSTLQTWSGSALEIVTLPDTINYKTLTADTDGTFSAYGGEVYYCESESAVPSGSALFAYDGTAVRNLGVPGFTGKIGNPHASGEVDDTDPANVHICSSQDFGDGLAANNCGCGCADAGEFVYHAIPELDCDNGSIDTGTCPIDDCETPYLCAPHMPGYTGLFCWSIPVACTDNNGRGEKILNCAFRVGLYDPKRNIFGRASDPRSVINFGPNRSANAMYQYQIKCNKPDCASDIATAGYKLAVWCTVGTEILDFKTWKTVGPFLLTGTSHAMSEYLGGQTFLEGIFNASAGEGGNPEVPGCTGLCLYKDQTLLANSGAYNNTYDRPVPSKSMCILDGGTTLYFYPVELDPAGEPYTRGGMTDWGAYRSGPYENFGNNNSAYRFGAEYSVGHPEQIGRITDTKETFTPLPHLKGSPVRIFNDGGSNIMLTRQGIYQIGFNGSAQIKEVGGPGIINGKSYHPTSQGVFYVADEGPVWLKGGKAVPIIRQLGFDGWIDRLRFSAKRKIRIGLMEDSNKILASFPSDIPNRHRMIMHDIEDGFTSEWWEGTGQSTDPDEEEGSTNEVEYMSSFRSDHGYQFIIWNNGSKLYDPYSGINGNAVSIVETWINENSHLTKQLNNIIVNLGNDTTGDVVIRVCTFDNPGNAKLEVHEPTESRNLTLGNSKLNTNIISHFMQMRGKFIRIRIESSENDALQLSRIAAEIQYDDDPRMLGETSSELGDL
jgi:hypothetical protein